MQPVSAARTAFTTVALIIGLTIVALAVASPPWDGAGQSALGGLRHLPPDSRAHFLSQWPSSAAVRPLLGHVPRRCAGLPGPGREPDGGVWPSCLGLRVIVVLGAFIAIMGFDGVNSYLSFFPTAPHLYAPNNLFRVSTGLLNGLALSLIVYPVFNYTLWRRCRAPRVDPALVGAAPFFVPMALIVWGAGDRRRVLAVPICHYLDRGSARPPVHGQYDDRLDRPPARICG